MSKDGYAVGKDGTGLGWFYVNGSEPDPEDPSKTYPDYETHCFRPFSAGVPPDPKPSLEQALGLAEKERDRLLGIAAIRIAPLQYAADLGDATPEEAALLKKWKQYSVDLNRVPGQPDYPQTIGWPTEPS
ncbi:tail fiber assembly protein [Pseudomonas sp. GXZC]|uniref:tail fiber assembly protein n=1 Tax=Pseudomonas sp. GXZC TaxID=3003351 RepID=UPI0022AB1FC0|nr:tail fiber assembly protein [Pseudomonas sp. GXZC]WAT26720.1 tail fiber assembly protein [Pseudomonas sp. GXZC]